MKFLFANKESGTFNIVCFLCSQLDSDDSLIAIIFDRSFHSKKIMAHRSMSQISFLWMQKISISTTIGKISTENPD